MPRPQSVTMTGDGNSATIPINWRGGNSGFGVSLAGIVAGGSTLTWKVQHTLDDIYAVTAAGGTINWLDHASLTGKTASADGNYAFPIRAVRLVVSGFAAGSVTLTIIEQT